MQPRIHVAAMPFPSPQGTQASIAAMLEALSDRGDAPELWTYAHGAHTREANYRVRRLWDVPRDRSLRSGPSINKVLLDMQLVARLAVGDRGAVVAHHVEAALAARLAGRRYVFFAHTDLERELPLYQPRVPAASLQWVGRTLDSAAAEGAVAVAAISPRLADTLQRKFQRSVSFVPTPWIPQAPAHADADRRTRARAELGIASDDDVMLYAGNLDRYQGWELLIGALRWMRRSDSRVRLLIATESATPHAVARAQQAGVGDAIVVTGLADEAARTRCHDAADLCVVPRRAEGGLPIKLLDALARSLPTIAMERATAGLPLTDVVEIVANDSAEAIGRAALDMLRNGQRRQALTAAGSRYLREQHSHAKFLAAFDRLVGT